MFHKDLITDINFVLRDIANTNRSIDKEVYNRLKDIEKAILVSALVISKTTKPTDTLEKAYKIVDEFLWKKYKKC